MNAVVVMIGRKALVTHSGGLVLGRIAATVCKYRLVLQHVSTFAILKIYNVYPSS